MFQHVRQIWVAGLGQKPQRLVAVALGSCSALVILSGCFWIHAYLDEGALFMHFKMLCFLSGGFPVTLQLAPRAGCFHRMTASVMERSRISCMRILKQTRMSPIALKAHAVGT
jgi:hypothetical protein